MYNVTVYTEQTFTVVYKYVLLIAMHYNNRKKCKLLFCMNEKQTHCWTKLEQWILMQTYRLFKLLNQFAIYWGCKIL